MSVLALTAVLDVASASQDDTRDAGELPVPLPPPPQPVLCEISVCCHPLAFDTAWHCYTKCVRRFPDGRTETTVCRGGPGGGGINPFKRKSKPPNLRPDCPNLNLFEAPDGAIDTYCGLWQEGHPDWKKRKKAVCNSLPSTDACTQCECFRDTFCSIQKCCVRYRVIEENSNSAVYTALAQCAIQDLAKPLGEDDWIPGWNKNIIADHNCPPEQAPPGNTPW